MQSTAANAPPIPNSCRRTNRAKLNASFGAAAGAEFTLARTPAKRSSRAAIRSISVSRSAPAANSFRPMFSRFSFSRCLFRISLKMTKSGTKRLQILSKRFFQGISCPPGADLHLGFGPPEKLPHLRDAHLVDVDHMQEG